LKEYRSAKITPLSEMKPVRKSHPFLVFCVIWFFFLILAAVLFLGKFHQYLISYEAEYQASLPEHAADDAVEIISSGNMLAVHYMQTEKPEISEFETEENLCNYMASLVEGKTIAWAKTDEYTEEAPDYYITADEYIVARLTLEKSKTEERPYKLPCWDTSLFEFYTEAQHSVRVSCPTSMKVTINGHEIDNKYCYKNDPSKGGEYFGDEIELPHVRTYLVKDLYEKATVEAFLPDNTKIKPEYNSTRGMYVVPFTVSEEVKTEMLDFMQKAATTYIHYVANDASQAQAAAYFKSGTNYLQMVEYGTSRQYYPWHRIQSEECEVVEFCPYDDDHFYCQMDIHQVLLLYGTTETPVDTECRYYCVRTADGFKVCGLEY